MMDMTHCSESEEEEEESVYYGCGARRLKPRSTSHHQQQLLMDCVGDSSAEIVTTLPDYERLSQSARLSDDPDPAAKKPPLSPKEEQKLTAIGSSMSPLQQQQKPVAWRLIEYVRSRNNKAPPPAGVAAAGCSSASDGDSKSSDGDQDEEGKTDKSKKKKRSSWLPDPERRWPVQGFY